VAAARVAIAGGGVAAVEALLALRELAGDRAEVRVFAPRRDFVYRPHTVGQPFGAAGVARYDLERVVSSQGASFHLDSIVAVEADARLVVTHDGERFAYDHLIVCPGAKALWPVPGATTFWGGVHELAFEQVVERLLRGAVRRVAFTTPGVESWALPLYELALLAQAKVEAAGIADVEIEVVTPEAVPLGIFGRRAGVQVADLLAERGIVVHAGLHPNRFEGGRLRVVPGGAELIYDEVVTLPKLEGRRIRGVPHDPEGFVRVDEHCRVIGRDRIYAAGDVTSFPVKQGGIATQQADAAVEVIAAELGAPVEPAPFDPALRAVLWTGGRPRYLQGWIGGGHGEASELTDEPPWGEDEGKVVGRFITPYLAGSAISTN